MKICKNLFNTMLVALLSLGLMYAQDVNEAIELYNNGVTAFQNAQYDQAIADIEKALSIVSSIEDEQAATVKQNCETLIPQLYYRLGGQYAENKKYTESLTSLNQANTLSEKYNNESVKKSVETLFAQVYTAIGNDEVAANKFTEGVDFYKKALGFTPDNSTLYLRMALAQLKAKDDEGAIDSFEKTIETGEIANKTNDVTNAKKQLGTIYLKRAAAAQSTKKWNVVYENAQKAAEYDATNVQTQKLIGTSSIELKKWDDALDALEKVEKADPAAKDITTTLYRLALANENKGNKPIACGYYKRIVGDANFKSIAEYKIKEFNCQ